MLSMATAAGIAMRHIAPSPHPHECRLVVDAVDKLLPIPDFSIARQTQRIRLQQHQTLIAPPISQNTRICALNRPIGEFINMA
jgi:hypothetical protein